MNCIVVHGKRRPHGDTPTWFNYWRPPLLRERTPGEKDGQKDSELRGPRREKDQLKSLVEPANEGRAVLKLRRGEGLLSILQAAQRLQEAGA